MVVYFQRNSGSDDSQRSSGVEGELFSDFQQPCVVFCGQPDVESIVCGDCAEFFACAGQIFGCFEGMQRKAGSIAACRGEAEGGLEVCADIIQRGDGI